MSASRSAGGPAAPPRLDLYWIPLGAGARVVRINGKIYERIVALRQRRQPRDLYHSALVASTGGDRFVIEMTPIPNSPEPSERGIVAEGPVGTRWLGRFRLFRYEIRRWRNGVIPDIGYAVGSVTVTDDAAAIEQVLDLLPLVPTPVWGRDELQAGDMWNSNSVVSWALTRARLTSTAIRPPDNGRAPGWDAGVLAATRGLTVTGGGGRRSGSRRLRPIGG
jgi:hypothetical protein